MPTPSSSDEKFCLQTLKHLAAVVHIPCLLYAIGSDSLELLRKGLGDTYVTTGMVNLCRLFHSIFDKRLHVQTNLRFRKYSNSSLSLFLLCEIFFDRLSVVYHQFDGAQL